VVVFARLVCSHSYSGSVIRGELKGTELCFDRIHYDDELHSRDVSHNNLLMAYGGLGVAAYPTPHSPPITLVGFGGDFVGNDKHH